MQGFRTGAKQEDINAMRRMNAEGRTVEEISQALRVVPTCVKAFVDRFNGKTKPRNAQPAAEPVPAKRGRKPKEEAKEAPPPPDFEPPTAA